MAAPEIVDAHMHLWDLAQNYYPWLCDEPAAPHRYGDPAPIHRSFLPHNYRSISAKQNIVATVHVEAEWRIVLDTIELFGTDRVMFGSNFPPDSLATDFDTIFSGFVEIVGGLTAAEQGKLLAGNARRIYRIE